MYSKYLLYSLTLTCVVSEKSRDKNKEQGRGCDSARHRAAAPIRSLEQHPVDDPIGAGAQGHAESQPRPCQLILKIEDGYIRGALQQLDDSNKTVYAFRGIPYAKPPVGNLRFEPPQRNDRWKGILDARYDRSECVQSIFSPISGSEDCLYINVYTPKLNGNLPVLAWIHGGGFIKGNSSYAYYKPDPLLQHQDVVYVSFNYRLGIFGFMSTGDLVVPGNMGLKDQCAALKWIRRNVARFGGDPNKVTLFGESAGSASVSYQLQSECSKNLYRAAIMQSGTSLCLWSLTRNASFIANQTAQGLRGDVTNTSTMVDFLKKVPYKDLQQVGFATGVGAELSNLLGGLMFSPVIEPPHQGAFFTSYSHQILSEGKFNRVPVIIGLNSNEANVVNDLPNLLKVYVTRYDVDYTGLAPADLTNDTLKRDSAAFAVKLRYFGLLPLAVQPKQLVKFVSDDQFNRPIIQTAIQMAKYVPVYFYRLSYKGELANGGNISTGVGHGEDLYYLFKYENNPVSTQDGKTRERLVKLWTNFAKYENPTPDGADPLLQNVTWERVGKNNKSVAFLDIDASLSMSNNPFKDSIDFYNIIYNDYGDPPYNTY